MASSLAKNFCLRSGAAAGADTAFEAGALASFGQVQIFLPFPGFRGHQSRHSRPLPQSFEMAKAYHPAWAALSPAARALHARNAHQVLGPNLNDPVKFVLCWTPDGCSHASNRTKETGGTGTAISLACANGVKVLNLANVGSLDFFAAQGLGCVEAIKLHRSYLSKCGTKSHQALLAGQVGPQPEQTSLF